GARAGRAHRARSGGAEADAGRGAPAARYAARRSRDPGLTGGRRPPPRARLARRRARGGAGRRPRDQLRGGRGRRALRRRAQAGRPPPATARDRSRARLGPPARHPGQRALPALDEPAQDRPRPGPAPAARGLAPGVRRAPVEEGPPRGEAAARAAERGRAAPRSWPPARWGGRRIASWSRPSASRTFLENTRTPW